jgi:protein-disulfide isomerase
MRPLPLSLITALACLLGACRTAAPAAASPAPAAQVAAIDGAAPTLPVEGLTPEQRQVLETFAASEFCHCGCPHAVGSCLASHRSCRHAPRMLRLAAALARDGADLATVRRMVSGYYGSFETKRRVKLDVEGYGPALGNPDAPITLVEFSDFACPYCQLLRPRLERFVEANASRVRLFFKPYPLERIHPGALEAAQAAEWARQQDLFWPMHDALFSTPAFSLDDLADRARELGGDPGDLRDAITSGRHLDRVRAAQLEAFGAGVRGTPTLFFDGRLLTLAAIEEILEMTLADEEEWRANGGWARD